MKSASNKIKPIQYAHFQIGEMYVFYLTQSDSSGLSLWGIYSHRQADGAIVCEVMTHDNWHFETWVTLPTNYQYYRKSKRSELRDFTYNRCYFECKGGS